MRPVVWIEDPSLKAQEERLASGALTASERGERVASVAALRSALENPDTVAFLDGAALGAINALRVEARPDRVIGVTSGTLASAIGWLGPYPWLSHAVSSSMLDHPFAKEHLAHVTSSMGTSRLRLLDWLGPDVGGRRIRLSRSVKRVERLERMSGFLEAKGVSNRTIEQLRDVAEELLTNAFYDAPVAAGALEKPISRTDDVVLPDQLACDLAYGCRDDLAIVRVKDPFGSLTRTRLMSVLARCSRTDMGVEVDESMGGAGLGMWRVFSNSSFVAISVDAHSHTEIMVGVAKRAPGPRPFAFHLYFRDGKKPRSWKIAHEAVSAPASQRAVNLELRSK